MPRSPQLPSQYITSFYVSPTPARYQEYEADAIGARIMARAGFDPASNTVMHVVRSCSQVRPGSSVQRQNACIDLHTCSSTLWATYRTC